ncbi:MAG: hypothetical protein ACXVDD_09385 [Polyangia bacterium]
MSRFTALLMMAGALAAGCGPGSGSLNPPQLWLALDGDELHAKLSSTQPPHY